ncbi:hypothetical protein MTBPR1_260012 [Candidatus Terasakiella magnetica]|uniref:Uncharacterized protein n=1 Tax=Candidatus Terasakiella magnetica TaxID=1867952 RepID=A0A1C3RH46_9PROT|nr:hypothetical protein MTBPR1_260012 [Candidatus Terasakiella magnetica]
MALRYCDIQERKWLFFYRDQKNVYMRLIYEIKIIFYIHIIIRFKNYYITF